MILPSDDQLFRNIPSSFMNSSHRMNLLYRVSSVQGMYDEYRYHRCLPAEHIDSYAPGSIAQAYERALTGLADEFRREKTFSGEGKEYLAKWQRKVSDAMFSVIDRYLCNSPCSIDEFPLTSRRNLFSGTYSSKTGPKQETEFQLNYDPFQISSDLPRKLEQHLKILRPILVNPHARKAKKHLIIFSAAVLLSVVSYGVFVASGMAAEMTVPFSIFSTVAMVDAIPLLRHGLRFLKWQSTKGRDKKEDARHREQFQQDAKDLHRLIRFYRLWSENGNRELPAFFSQWEQQLHQAVEEFNALPLKY